LAELAQKAADPEIVQISRGDQDKAGVLIIPQGHRAEPLKPYLDPYRTAPERRRGTAKLVELDSFIEHVNRFKDADSAIFAVPDPKLPTLTCVLDYHRAGSDASPRFGDHRATYTFPVSDEWTTWNDENKEPMGQRDFAEFIESHVRDVADPKNVSGAAEEDAKTLGVELATAASVVEVARRMSVRVNSKMKSAVSLSTGETEIQYETTHSDEKGQPLRAPSAFLIGIPVFKNGALYPIVVRLRYRVQEGMVVWFYELYGTDRVFDFAFKKACERAKTETALPVLFGSPEV
jgi:uncharacterized protein YfdQ (DUF2303 family)